MSETLHSRKWLLVGGAALALFLVLGGIFVWRFVKDGRLEALRLATNILPVSAERKNQITDLLTIADSLMAHDGRERTFLLLLQNNWELRPGGGFIGTYGVLKLKDGRIVSLEIDDTYNFDRRVPAVVPVPYPLEELRIKSWNLRDSNFSPDFAVNARQAERFYALGGGKEKLDGVIGITANMLTALVKVTGPIALKGYPGVFTDADAIYTLEHQVERAYVEQGIPKNERKSVIENLAREILNKLQPLGPARIITLSKTVFPALEQKDVQLYFADAQLQGIAERQRWAGRVDVNWPGDYLMLVDTNLNALKSDYVMRRELRYAVDRTGEKPRAVLFVTYRHTGKTRDWLIGRYRSYGRIFVPGGSALIKLEGATPANQGDDLGKKFFGFFVEVPVGGTAVVRIEYDLPGALKSGAYHLKTQKQAGVESVPVELTVQNEDGTRIERSFTVTSDATAP
ncbi:MAG: DUF4012 domain-containing protein [bacterium]|nr:DUF4012 domain-containing protein [bacterium]MDZ4296363.1 DUF4012 domain-containing protein [Patescibacteria group bacterium]